MKSITIEGQLRTGFGKSATRQLRSQELVPGVIYGGAQEISFTAPAAAFKNLVYTPSFQLAEVNVDGKTYRTILKDLQFDKVNDHLIHVDFLELVDDAAAVDIAAEEDQDVAPLQLAHDLDRHLVAFGAADDRGETGHTPVDQLDAPGAQLDVVEVQLDLRPAGPHEEEVVRTRRQTPDERQCPHQFEAALHLVLRCRFRVQGLCPHGLAGIPHAGPKVIQHKTDPAAFFACRQHCQAVGPRLSGEKHVP